MKKKIIITHINIYRKRLVTMFIALLVTLFPVTVFANEIAATSSTIYPDTTVMSVSPDVKYEDDTGSVNDYTEIDTGENDINKNKTSDDPTQFYIGEGEDPSVIYEDDEPIVEESSDSNTQTINQYETSKGDITLLAQLIQHEAGNQPYSGKVAVAEVVMNRVYCSKFPNTIRDVIYSPGQFQNSQHISSITPTNENIDIAHNVICGTEKVFYNSNVLYFKNPTICNGISPSNCKNWGNHEWYSYIGNHAFYLA